MQPDVAHHLIDGVELREFDYIDIGELIPTSSAVPVSSSRWSFQRMVGAGPHEQERGHRQAEQAHRALISSASLTSNESATRP